MSIPSNPGDRIRIAIVASLLLLAQASAAPVLEIGTASGDSSGPTAVPVTFQSDVPAAALQFDFAYDSAALDAGPAGLAPGFSGFSVASSTPSPGVGRVVIYSLNNGALPSGGIVNLQFTPRSNVRQLIPLTPRDPIAAQASGQAIPSVALRPGSFTVLGAQALRFSSASVAGGQIRLQIAAPPGSIVTLQTSIDLVKWSDLKTAPANPRGIADFSDLASAGARYYRAAQ